MFPMVSYDESILSPLSYTTRVVHTAFAMSFTTIGGRMCESVGEESNDVGETVVQTTPMEGKERIVRDNHCHHFKCQRVV